MPLSQNKEGHGLCHLLILDCNAPHAQCCPSSVAQERKGLSRPPSLPVGNGVC